MGISRKNSSSSKANNNDKQREEVKYKYSSSSTNFWSKDKSSMLKVATRKATVGAENRKSFAELSLNIYPLDENGKMIKNEDDKYESSYFILNFNDLVKLVYALKSVVFPTKKTTYLGAIINHISKETNSGSQLEIALTDDGFVLTILYITEGEITDTFEHPLSNDQIIRYYDENGEEGETTANLDIISLYYLLESAIGIIGIGGSLVECWGGSSLGKSTSGGKLNSRRTIGASSINAKLQDMEDEDDEDTSSEESDDSDEEETPEAPKKKVISSSKSSKPKNAKSMKEILEEDDD